MNCGLKLVINSNPPFYSSASFEAELSSFFILQVLFNFIKKSHIDFIDKQRSLYCNVNIKEEFTLQAVFYSQARNNLRSIINKACTDFEQFTVTTKDNQSVVIMSSDEYNAIKETMYLYFHPKIIEKDCWMLWMKLNR